MAVKIGLLKLKRKAFCLCCPSLWTCLLVVAVSRLNGIAEKHQSAMWSVLVLLSLLLRPEGSAA